MIPEKSSMDRFPETADIETSSDDYASRFSGAVGQWMLEVQERITLELLADPKKTPILDVGGGHGQLAIPICRKGFPVTVLGSAESCRKRLSDILDEGRCKFRVGNVIDMPFPDRSFDTVICFRLLTHCTQWKKLVSELCRVARKTVIADYPTSQSVNAIAPLLFKAKKKLEGNTRTWTLFEHEQVHDEFEKQGFRLQKHVSQFLLPMVMHRVLRSRRLSSSLENLCRSWGLTRRWGSPVIVRMVRRD